MIFAGGTPALDFLPAGTIKIKFENRWFNQSVGTDRMLLLCMY